MSVLHYIYDPLCGWCYGAAPLVTAALEVPGLSLQLHGGGLWPAPTRLPDSMRQYIREADIRIGSMSGQPFGSAYVNQLLDDPALVLESRATTAAVLAAEFTAQGRGLDMLRAIQRAHYVEGRHVVRDEELLALAAECGIAADTLPAALDQVDVRQHIQSTRELMRKLGVNGFPAFALEIYEHWYTLPHQRFGGNPAGFAEWLAAQMSQARARLN